MILSVVLCGRDSWSVLLWEKHGLRVFAYRVMRKIEFKNILGQLVMATKESHCLTKQYVIYHEDLCGVEVQVHSLFISDVHIQVSAQFVVVGARGKAQSANWIRNWAGRTEGWREEIFLRCSSPDMIPQCSSWSRHSAELKVLKTKRYLIYTGKSPYRAVNTFHHSHKNQSVDDV